jgi:hypothetical protein
MQRALASDRVLQNRDHVIDRFILLLRNFAQGPTVMWGMFNSESLVKNLRRDPIRMRDVGNAHPRAYDFVTVQSPIHRSSHCANGEEARYHDDQQERRQEHPLFPSKLFHRETRFDAV